MFFPLPNRISSLQDKTPHLRAPWQFLSFPNTILYLARDSHRGCVKTAAFHVRKTRLAHARPFVNNAISIDGVGE